MADQSYSDFASTIRHRDDETASSTNIRTANADCPMVLRQVLARNVAAARRRRGVSQRELALSVGMSPSAVSQVERAMISTRLDSIERIANALAFPVHALLDPQFGPGR